MCATVLFSCKAEKSIESKEPDTKKVSEKKSAEKAPAKSDKRRAKKMNLVRRPAVAGAFYPSSPREINSMISEYFDDATVEDVDKKLLGLVVPHAGYVYSGPVAAYSYKAIKHPENIETVVILGPSHRAPFQGISVFPGGVYQTPLGDLEIDEEIAAELLSSDDKIKYVEQAHTYEHSLEVQLPFIQTVFDKVKIVTAVFGSPDREADEQFIDTIVKIAKKKKILIVASSDFSHYYDYKTAQKMDDSGIKSILKMSDKELMQKNYRKESELCGIYPVQTLIRIMNKLNGTDARLLRYANSGDVPVGSKAQVVGYAAIAFYESDDPKAEAEVEETKQEEAKGEGLNSDEKKQLLKIAKDTINQHVLYNKRLKVSDITNPKLLVKSGAFVTINKGGDLRGCIGNFVSRQPLYETVIDMAISAASRDPRFSPVKKGELDDLELEISVLSPLRKITDVNEIEVGKHGIYIIKGRNRGVLLPQVATEYGWDRLTFLEQTCRKAGLDMDAWKEGADILIFDAEVFSEEELHH
jgi:AmmeMemoRadiSam system protein B/AmmeMemoRadiSam system protein A